ncbi:MAG TPA: glycosyltransferase family 4 protein [Vicinamibacterales bacterium]|nr:glycosyltransferase family 4 protein [Vicinamibacterales bacterium]
MKLAVVVQRYGADINGGAELHARYIAEHLARHAEVEVLTTCARDYVTWRNERPAGEERVNGLPVRRFPVRRPRDPDRFGRWSQRVFHETHSIADERAWLDAEGPTSPRLVAHLARAARRWDVVLFFSYRYYHAYHGAAALPDRAVLVPTAERDPAVALSLFGPLFRGVRALMYNSPEERALIQGVSGNEDVPGVVVGVGSEIPERPEAGRFRQKYGLSRRFAIYVGRIDENKGCKELFDFHRRYARSEPDPLQLVLCGHSLLPIPDTPHVRHLGFVSDADKYDGLAAADVLIMPSYFESLSMVALEAWALGRPVLANARCDVLKGQSLRSNGGLYYRTYEEFAESLSWIVRRPQIAAALGANGREYFRRTYAWPVVERKYLDMFDRLRREGAGARSSEWPPALPGWFARRRPTLPPAASVLERVPAGAVIGNVEAT